MPGGNVVFVVMDTVRKDRLSIYGADEPTSPALETVAESATVFEQAVAPAPWTLPVHASLFTGLYPGEHEANQERPYLEDVTTLAETLSAAGYESACYSSNAWITPYTGLTAGFDAQDNFFQVLPGDLLSGPLARAWKAMNEDDRLRAIADKLVELGNSAHEYLAGGDSASSKTRQAIDRAMEFISGAGDDWFLFLNLMDAHLPYHPPEEYAEQFAPGVDSSNVCQNSKEYNAGARNIDDEEWNGIRGLYDAEIRHADAELERFWTWLQANDCWEDTLVIVCADHGELHGEHDLYGHEFCIYDPLVNVPLVIKHPELETGRREDQVELLDLYHTVLDHTDASPPSDAVLLDPTRSLLRDRYRKFDGAANAYVEYARPVVELNQLETKAANAGIELDEHSRFYSRMRAVRRPDAKYIRNERIDDEFYRLDADPRELNNRADANDETAGELEAALASFEARVGPWGDDRPADDVLGEMGDDAQERLRDLGYLK